MKKLFIIYSLAALTLPVLTGCEKYLDVKPTGSVDESEALKTSSDVEAALIGAYSDMGDADVYGGSLHVISELLSSGNELEWTGTFETYRDVYRKSVKTVNTQVSFIWMDSYRVINDVNNVLSAIDLVTADKKERIEGEAKFLRACMYFELVRLFAKPWHQGDPTQNDGVPIYLEPYRAPLTDEDKKPRSKVSEVYAQVIKDLTDAESLLEVPGQGEVFAHKIAAQAMLSRVYLQKGDYPNALAAANRAIQTNDSDGPFRLMNTYDAAFPYSANETAILGNTDEDVFATQVSNTDGVNDFNTYFSQRGRGDIYMTQNHINLYEPNDSRLDLFDEVSSGTYVTYKFDMPYASVHLIRLAELYLTRAEANFRGGTTVGDTPLNDINRIRERAGLDLYDDDADITLARILRERKLELAFEGFTLHDAKRTQTNIGATPWNSPLLVLPIPERERLVNTNLTQNDGYGN